MRKQKSSLSFFLSLSPSRLLAGKEEDNYKTSFSSCLCIGIQPSCFCSTGFSGTFSALFLSFLAVKSLYPLSLSPAPQMFLLISLVIIFVCSQSLAFLPYFFTLPYVFTRVRLFVRKREKKILSYSLSYVLACLDFFYSLHTTTTTLSQPEEL